MGTIYIDDKEVNFTPGQNVLDAALKAGIDTPYFCYHEALGSAGSCRVCAMELEPAKEGDRSRVVMTCMQPAQDGQRYRLNQGSADKVRKNVVEYYMTRHPHDCPVCDEAGECHLQDMTILSHQTYRRYDGKKRTFSNQDMGSLIWNTANRCITCYRCVRFYQNYALGDDLGTYGSGQRTTFRRSDPGAFESPFSGNLVDVCPTGTFTDKVYRRKYSRTWQLEKAPSVCGHCSTGCNTEPGGRQGTLRRIYPNSNAEVNPHFICDRGRYGEHFSEAKDRPLTPLHHGKQDTQENVLNHIKDRLENANGRVGVLSSGHEDIETHLMLQKLARYYEGMFSPFVLPKAEERTRAAMKASISPPSLTEIEQADGAVVIGALTEAAPMMDLAVRQLIAKGKPVYMVHAAPSLLSDLIKKHSCGRITQVAPKLWAETINNMNASEELAEMGPNLFANLDAGKNIVVLGVAGEMDVSAINALHELSRGLERKHLYVQLGFALEAANAAGAAMISTDNSAQAMIDAIVAGSVDTLVVCGADPLGMGSADWNKVRSQLNQLIVLDNIGSETVKDADVVLPFATWSERSGLTLSYEGRLQAFSRAYHRKGVFSVHNFVSALLPQTENELYAVKDSWVMEHTDQLILAGQTGLKVDLAKAFGALADADQAVSENDEGLQVVRLPWHGGGDKADYAPDLASNKPWIDDRAYMHPQTTKSLKLKDGEKLKLKTGVELSVICSDRVATGCMAVTRSTLKHIGYPVNTVLGNELLSIGEEA